MSPDPSFYSSKPRQQPVLRRLVDKCRFDRGSGESQQFVRLETHDVDAKVILIPNGSREEGWVTAMVGGDYRKTVRAQQGLDLRCARIERFERCRIAGNIAAVAEGAVEIDEICEQQTLIERIDDCFERCIEQRHVAICLDCPGDAAMGENIGNLADGDDSAARLGEAIKQGFSRWRYRKVAPVGGA